MSAVRSSSILNTDFKNLFDPFVTAILLEGNVESEAPVTQGEKEWTSGENILTCSYCRVTFPNKEQQKEHYKLDWHRYNLKQALQVKSPIKEEEFNRKTENDDVSSISGSESEEEDTLDTLATAQGKMFLQTRDGKVFSIYQGILLVDKKEELSSVNFYERFKNNWLDNNQWAILMLGGGHFAGSVFRGETPIVHKTFHCYTVRAGQGGSQASRDNKSAGSHPKSAGASLRRYNEQALVDHVQGILTTWSSELINCSLIFYRASGPHNRSVLFGGGKDALLDRADPRLRTIPFSTGRATFTEVKRVHSKLCSVTIYDSLEEATSRFSKQKSENKRNKTRSSCINRAKSREVLERPLPAQIIPVESSEEDDDLFELDNENLEVSFQELQEFGDSLTPEQRKHVQSRRKPRKSKNQKLREKEQSRKKHLMDILVKGNVLLLDECLQERLKTFEEGTNVTKEELACDFFSEVLDDDGNSFLHLAAMNEHEDLLNYLLDNQADPCLKNKNLQTPYSCSTSKISRDAFKKFAKENPDKYNYNKALIPVNALTEEEMAEKKRAQRKVKREKEKEKKKENFMKRKEEEQKDRFLHLSDREKRALAAERRILNAQGTVIARCFLCGSDMAGKVPFEYLENRFCSIDCLKSHRMKSLQ